VVKTVTLDKYESPHGPVVPCGFLHPRALDMLLRLRHYHMSITECYDAERSKGLPRLASCGVRQWAPQTTSPCRARIYFPGGGILCSVIARTRHDKSFGCQAITQLH
jgi:hypothetical protein